MLAASSCGADLIVSAGNLDIVPNPAQQGQAVTFVFALTVFPAQTFTAVAVIDGEEYASVTRVAAVDSLFQIPVGDAGELIARFGLGTHIGYVAVRLDERGRAVRTADESFELQAPPPSPNAATSARNARTAAISVRQHGPPAASTAPPP